MCLRKIQGEKIHFLTKMSFGKSLVSELPDDLAELAHFICGRATKGSENRSAPPK